MDNILSVSSEIGTLKRLLVHSPDSGLGKVVPSKAQDWLFEDIVHLDTIRRTNTITTPKYCCIFSILKRSKENWPLSMPPRPTGISISRKASIFSVQTK
jgi:hypothetical protein